MSSNKVPVPARLPEDLVEKARDVAYWERLHLGEVVERALLDYFRKLERRRGEPFPKRKGPTRRGRPMKDRDAA